MRLTDRIAFATRDLRGGAAVVDVALGSQLVSAFVLVVVAKPSWELPVSKTL